jgi:hypothetical protein
LKKIPDHFGNQIVIMCHFGKYRGTFIRFYVTKKVLILRPFFYIGRVYGEIIKPLWFDS